MSDHNSHKLPPSSSALIALSSLAPPSPILSPIHLATTCISGDIPFLFNSNLRETRDHHRQINLNNTVPEVDIFPVSSLSGAGIVGTFGPTYQSRRSKPSTPSLFEPVTTNTAVNPQSVHSCFSDPPPTPLSNACNNGPSAITPMHLLSSADRVSIVNRECCLAPAFKCNLGNPSLYNLQTEMPSDLFLTNVCDNGQPVSCGQPSNSYPASEVVRPRTRTALMTNEDGLVDAHIRQIPAAAVPASFESKCYSAPSSPQTYPIPNYLPNHSLLRQAMSKTPAWLSATVEILIDQEGFRGGLARFKYSGHIYQQLSEARSGRNKDEFAHFRPVKRQVFNFHYAPIDGLPVLRRITINEDETRDYISRQASLGLKSNGVYVVRGTEVSSFTAPHANGEHSGIAHTTESSRLHWRFEYLVNDRRAETPIKKMIDGEKVLTPLTFSCSPLLLHPLQGKRIRLMHVVKKTVSTKLTAEKMEPPDVRSSLPTSPSPSHSTTVAKIHIQTTANRLSTKSHAWNIHKRAKSQAMHEKDCLKVSINTAINEIVNQSNSGPGLTRRRRASSAGERSRPSSRALPTNTDHHNFASSHTNVYHTGTIDTRLTEVENLQYPSLQRV